MSNWFFSALCVVLVVCLFVSCQTGGNAVNEQRKMSAEMQRIIATLRISKWELDVSHLAKGDLAEFMKLKRSVTLEEYELPAEKGYEDTFRYTVYFDRESEQYWVKRTGGIAGVEEVYGPQKSIADTGS